MLELNPQSHVPLYSQLADRILARIRAGEFPVGDKLPSEHELARSYRVGRPTVRQATETLMRKGVLERRRGSGTFVRRESDPVDLFSLGGTIDSFGRRGLNLRTEWLELPCEIRNLSNQALPIASGRAFRCRRLGKVDDEGVLIETFWFESEMFADFDRLDLQGRSLSEIASTHYGQTATGADQRFLVELLGKDDAAVLGLPESEPVLRVERTIHFESARSAVFVEMQCRSDRFAFAQTIGSAPGATAVEWNSC